MQNFFFNNIFADIDPKLASEILQLNNQHLQFINAALSLLKNITINKVEFQTASFTLKGNKSRGYDEISANIIR